MRAIWDYIEFWLETNAPEIQNDLLPGVSDKEICSVEEFLSIEFPDDVTTSYRIHNGQRGGAPLMGEWQIFSLNDMMSRWKILKDLFDAGTFADTKCLPVGPVRAEWWNPKWIPLAYNGAGDYHCLDLDPAPKGEIGQIIVCWHMIAKRERVANSYRAWLQKFADDLKIGKYMVADGTLVKSNQTENFSIKSD